MVGLIRTAFWQFPSYELAQHPCNIRELESQLICLTRPKREKYIAKNFSSKKVLDLDFKSPLYLHPLYLHSTVQPLLYNDKNLFSFSVWQSQNRLAYQKGTQVVRLVRDRRIHMHARYHFCTRSLRHFFRVFRKFR